jgi:hypothetical protein
MGGSPGSGAIAGPSTSSIAKSVMDFAQDDNFGVGVLRERARARATANTGVLTDTEVPTGPLLDISAA